MGFEVYEREFNSFFNNLTRKLSKRLFAQEIDAKRSIECSITAENLIQR